MKITAQLSGVNRPLSVEFRLIHLCSCDFDSQEEHDTSFSRGVLTKRSDFRSAQGRVRYSPFGGVEFGQKSGRYSWTSPRRLATVIASVRLRTFNLVKMLRKCPFTV